MGRIREPPNPAGLPRDGWVGVDPGKDGTIGYCWGAGPSEAEFYRFDQMTDQEIWDVFLALSLIAKAAGLEKVGAMGFKAKGRAQGLGSTFKFGRSAGLVEGFMIASRMRWDHVTPVKWQGDLKCRTGGDKKITQAKAQQLWPHLEFTQKNAEGLLIAEWCRVHANWAR